MSLPHPPADASDADLWLAGYELRSAHLPIDGSPECPICQTNWECAAYRTGVEMMRAATDVPPPPLDEPRVPHI
ncbi:hypothetical protein [Cryptosporangium minutisporangium]|uniref:4Fe-4S Wbl-type domain-containing protein n=1 Tax=Cryptosporangium minutisporangium TaxID=113569 RepID=A0ABP6T8V7_9ACTN